MQRPGVPELTLTQTCMSPSMALGTAHLGRAYREGMSPSLAIPARYLLSGRLKTPLTSCSEIVLKFKFS